MEVELTPLLTFADFPPVVVHGTRSAVWPAIKSTGLSRMNRVHIHMASGRPGDEGVISGMRASSQVFIYINVQKALASGIQFFKSENGVILSPGNESGVIPVDCFLKVENAHGEIIN